MTNSTNLALALAPILAATMAVEGGNKYNSPADNAALPFSAGSANETSVRATKGDRLHVRPEIRHHQGELETAY